MKKKTRKANIYLDYFTSHNTILTQSQKRKVLVFMFFAGLFVLRTIFGFAVEFVYAAVGMFSIAVVLSFLLTEWVSREEQEKMDALEEYYTE